MLETGETVEDYPNDRPYPSRLMLGWKGQRPLHVVVADDVEESTMIVVTVYEPDTSLWKDNFRRRRQ